MMVEAIRLNPLAPMTVGDLRALLKDAPQEALVRLYTDAEENDEHNLLEIQIGKRMVWLRPYD